MPRGYSRIVSSNTARVYGSRGRSSAAGARPAQHGIQLLAHPSPRTRGAGRAGTTPSSATPPSSRGPAEHQRERLVAHLQVVHARARLGVPRIQQHLQQVRPALAAAAPLGDHRVHRAVHHVARGGEAAVLAPSAATTVARREAPGGAPRSPGRRGMAPPSASASPLRSCEKSVVPTMCRVSRCISSPASTGRPSARAWSQRSAAASAASAICVDEARQALAVKGGLHQPAVLQPGVALRGQDAVAGQHADGRVEAVRLAVVLAARLEDVLHAGRMRDQVPLDARNAAQPHHVAQGALGAGVQRRAGPRPPPARTRRERRPASGAAGKDGSRGCPPSACDGDGTSNHGPAACNERFGTRPHKGFHPTTPSGIPVPALRRRRTDPLEPDEKACDVIPDAGCGLRSRLCCRQRAMVMQGIPSPRVGPPSIASAACLLFPGNPQCASAISIQPSIPGPSPSSSASSRPWRSSSPLRCAARRGRRGSRRGWIGRRYITRRCGRWPAGACRRCGCRGRRRSSTAREPGRTRGSGCGWMRSAARRRPSRRTAFRRRPAPPGMERLNRRGDTLRILRRTAAKRRGWWRRRTPAWELRPQGWHPGGRWLAAIRMTSRRRAHGTRHRLFAAAGAGGAGRVSQVRHAAPRADRPRGRRRLRRDAAHRAGRARRVRVGRGMARGARGAAGDADDADGQGAGAVRRRSARREQPPARPRRAAGDVRGRAGLRHGRLGEPGDGAAGRLRLSLVLRAGRLAAPVPLRLGRRRAAATHLRRVPRPPRRAGGPRVGPHPRHRLRRSRAALRPAPVRAPRERRPPDAAHAGAGHPRRAVLSQRPRLSGRALQHRPAVRDGPAPGGRRAVAQLETADTAALAALGHRPPEPFRARAADGKTEIHGVIYTPADFDPARRYPVVDYIYAGPFLSAVQKEYAPTHRHAAHRGVAGADGARGGDGGRAGHAGA